MHCSCSKSASVIVVAASIAAAAGFIVGSSTPDADAARLQSDRHQDSDHAMPEMSPEMAQMMERWAKHSEITKQHEALQKSEGSWIVNSSWWMGPGAPEESHTFMATIRPIMGGRFMLEEMSGLMEMAPGQMTPWHGTAITGYDNHKEQFSFVWFDNTGTSLTIGYGDQTGRNEWTYEYEAYDPMMGAPTQRKNVITRTSDDQHVFDMYTKMPDGTWFKNMRMTYNRAG